ncbi:sugar transferase [Patescibacteria group bacterium]
MFTAPKRSRDILNLADVCYKRKIEFRFVPDIPRLISQYSVVTNISGIPPIFGIKSIAISGWGRIAKRAADIVVSLTALIIFSPILLFTALVIKLTDFGPIFYKQERVGREDKVFDFYKFRSMRTDADKFATWTIKNDPRITKIGKIIRKTSIDELPQLINVLNGEMSVVGPRPEQPKYVEEFSKEIPRYNYRHRVKGGITGWSQVNGLRGDTSIEERAKYDLYYIENWNLLFDLKIILLTIKTIFFTPGHTN